MEGDDRGDEYTTDLLERCTAVRQRIEILTDASITPTPPPLSADRMVAIDYEKLDDGDIAPTYFTYTLIDPDALGDQKMSAYAGIRVDSVGSVRDSDGGTQLDHQV